MDAVNRAIASDVRRGDTLAASLSRMHEPIQFGVGSETAKSMRKKKAPPPKKDSPRSTSSGCLVCRICLSEDITPENPLISPCKCSGTMKMIHIDCLREWLNSKCTIKNNDSVRTYCWKALECELCK